MPVMLERWNDDKMDALAAKVDRIEVELGEQRREMREELRDVRRAIIHGTIGLAGSMIAGFATVIAAVLLGA